MADGRQKPQKRTGRATRRLNQVLWAIVGLYLLLYILDSCSGGYWLIPARDGEHRFAPEFGGLSITDAIMWQPRFGQCAPGHLDRIAIPFIPLIQLDQRYFHKTHYVADPLFETWMKQLPRSKVHPTFRREFDDYNRTNHASRGNAGGRTPGQVAGIPNRRFAGTLAIPQPPRLTFAP